MSSTYGENLKLSIFGQSHGAAIGMTLDGIPAGLPVDPEKLQKFLNRRAPGRNDLSTPRKEEDKPEFLAGIVDGFTCGAPIAAVIHNNNAHPADYENLKEVPRPGHADYSAHVKYGGYQEQPFHGGHGVIPPQHPTEEYKITRSRKLGDKAKSVSQWVAAEAAAGAQNQYQGSKGCQQETAHAQQCYAMM